MGSDGGPSGMDGAFRLGRAPLSRREALPSSCTRDPYAGPMAIDVLLTGFEPFGGAEVNESWEAVQRAVPLLRAAGVRVECRELPVVFGRAGELLCTAVDELEPTVVIATGLAVGRRAVTPERVAINIRDARIPDNAGASPVDEPCVPGAPTGYFSTLPIKAMVQASTQEAEVPAAVSQTAGTFVCNDVFHLLQHHLAGGLVRSGFVHVPAAADLPVEDTARALAAMTVVALRTERDVSVGGGAEH